MVDKSLLAAVKTKMTLFESRGGGVKGRCLQLIYNYLMSIPPASVESERVFAAEGFCTKICSRLSDCMINILCFLHSLPGTVAR